MNTTYTRDELEQKTRGELLAIFNAIQDRHPDGRRVDRLDGRDSAINRILSIQEVLPTKLGRPRQLRGVYNLEGCGVARNYRATSGRGRVASILSGEGATFEQLLEQFPEWNENQLHNTIMRTAQWLGFNLTTDDDGVIRASR
jgi:hypothetical protein